MRIDEIDNNMPKSNTMQKYDEKLGKNQQWVEITEIVVPTEYAKEQLLLAFEYIHYLQDIDPNYMAVNTIMHLYTRPELIKVIPENVMVVDTK